MTDDLPSATFGKSGSNEAATNESGKKHSKKSNLLVAVEWLWSNRGKDIWWTPGTLAKHNPDPTSPKLTAVEAISIFRILLERGLIFPAPQYGQNAFLLHEAKEQEWNAFISILKREQDRQDKSTPNSRQKITQNAKKDKISARSEGLVSILEIGGGLIFITLGVVLSEAGFHFFGFFFYYLGVACGLAIVAHYLQKFGVRYVKTGLATLLILMAFLFVYLSRHELATNSSGAKPVVNTPNAHFSFSLGSPAAGADFLDLTNDSLVVSNWNTLKKPFVWLIVPVQIGQSNFTFNLRIHSPVDAEKLEVFVTFPKGWQSVPDSGWEPIIDTSSKWISLGLVGETNELQSWMFRVSDELLPGDGFAFPSIKITQIPLPKVPPTEGVVAIVAKAKNWLPEGIGFSAMFVPVPKEFSHKPFVQLAFITNNMLHVSAAIPLATTNELFNPNW